jgi:hypothetical protein
VHGFGAEVVAGAVVFDAEAGQGVAEGVARGIVFDAETVEATEQGAAWGVDFLRKRRLGRRQGKGRLGLGIRIRD